MGKFNIRTGTNGRYYFNLRADNGEIILSGECYTSRASCSNGIASVKTNAKDASNYEKKESSNGKYFFNLKASNGEIIGTSEMYASSSGRDGGIASVQSKAPVATVEDH